MHAERMTPSGLRGVGRSPTDPKGGRLDVPRRRIRLASVRLNGWPEAGKGKPTRPLIEADPLRIADGDC